jgi:hypothetical protein
MFLSRTFKMGRKSKASVSKAPPGKAPPSAPAPAKQQACKPSKENKKRKRGRKNPDPDEGSPSSVQTASGLNTPRSNAEATIKVAAPPRKLPDTLKADLVQLQEELQEIKPELRAMRAVFRGSEIPKGQEQFSENFRKIEPAEQMRLIVDRETVIANIEAHILKERTLLAANEVSLTEGGGAHIAGADQKAAGLFTWCEKLRQRQQTSTDVRLSRLVKPFDTDRLENEFRTAAAVVADSMGKREKEGHPLPVVIGAPGQGKTEVLYWITGQYPDIAEGPVITVNGPSIIAAEFRARLKEMEPAPAPICLFATFTQGGPFVKSEVEGKGIEAALTSRVAAWYTQREWSADLTAHTGCTLENLITEIRKKEKGGERRLVILAIDELRKIEEEQMLRDLLNIVAGLSHKQNHAMLPMFPIVSCLDVEGVLSVRSKSGGPLQPITLLPCSPRDMEEVLRVARPKWNVGEKTLRNWIFSTNGHYRSLEKLENGSVIKDGCMEAFPAQLALLRKIYQHESMLPKMTETVELDPFHKKRMTLFQCACASNYGIFYAQVDLHAQTVIPQLNMMCVANTLRSIDGDNKPVSDFLLSIIRKIGNLNAAKEAEQIVPLLPVLRAFLKDAPWIAEELLSVARVDIGRRVIKPWFIGWQPSDAACLCTRHLKVKDLENLYLTVDGTSETSGDTLIQSGGANSAGGGVRFAFPSAKTYPGIEGVVFGLLGDTNDPSKQYPLAVQMKCRGEVRPGKLAEWAQLAHDQMMSLGFRAGEYYVLLGTANLSPTFPDLPKGTLVVGPDFLEALCRPFGLWIPIDVRNQ